MHLSSSPCHQPIILLAWNALHMPHSPAPPSPSWRRAQMSLVHISLLIFLKDKHDPVTSAFKTFKCLLKSIQQIMNCCKHYDVSPSAWDIAACRARLQLKSVSSWNVHSSSGGESPWTRKNKPEGSIQQSSEQIMLGRQMEGPHQGLFVGHTHPVHLCCLFLSLNLSLSLTYIAPAFSGHRKLEEASGFMT